VPERGSIMAVNIWGIMIKEVDDWKGIFSQPSFMSPEWNRFRVQVGKETLWLSKEEILKK
jgi:hypothetical protein